MVQVPAISNWAEVPDTVQTVVVREVKLTGNWELAEAVRLIEMPSNWVAMGLKVIVCFKPTPVPLSVTVCVLPATALLLSVTVRAPLCPPVDWGVKGTGIWQLAFGDKELPQLLVWAKLPLMLIELIVRVAPPVLERITGCGGLVLSMFWLVKPRPEGERLAVPLRPVPAS